MDKPGSRQIFYTIALLVIISIGCIAAAGQLLARQLPIAEVWSGNFPVEALSILPDGQRDTPIGYIASVEEFASLWQRFKPDQPIPEVDFTRSIVIFARNTVYYNAIRIGAVNLEGGTAEVIAMETMSARPIEELVGISFVVVPRSNINRLHSGDTVIDIN